MTLRSSALESAALENGERASGAGRAVRDRVRGSGLRAVENSMYDDASAYGARSRSPGAVAGVTGAPPRARAGTTRVTALATANSGIRGNAGLDRTSAARRRAGCGALSTRCAVVSTGGTHLTHTTHPIMNGSLLCMHTRDTRTIPRQRISCLIIVVRHAFTHASLPSPPRAKHPRPGSSSGGRRHDGSSALVKGTSALPGTDCSALLLALAAAKDSAHG